MALALAFSAIAGCSGQAAFIPHLLISGPVQYGIYPPITPETSNAMVGDPGTGKRCYLEYSVYQGEFERFDQLLRNGADHTKCSSGYQNRLLELVIIRHCAAENLANNFLSRLSTIGISHSDYSSLLALASSYACLSGIRLAVSHGAVVNALDSTGLSPLHHATRSASEANIKAVSFLIELGADTALKSVRGETPSEQAFRLLSTARNWPSMNAALHSASK
jgi:hypothetical protein